MDTGRSRWHTIPRLGIAVLLAISAPLAVASCASDEPQQEDVPEDIPGYDPSVGTAGEGVETDEGRNQGFEGDEPSGNQSEVNDG